MTNEDRARLAEARERAAEERKQKEAERLAEHEETLRLRAIASRELHEQNLRAMEHRSSMAYGRPRENVRVITATISQENVDRSPNGIELEAGPDLPATGSRMVYSPAPATSGPARRKRAKWTAPPID